VSRTYPAEVEDGRVFLGGSGKEKAGDKIFEKKKAGGSKTGPEQRFPENIMKGDTMSTFGLVRLR